MRILQVLYYSALGGIENYTRDLFRVLETRGHENVLVVDGATLPGLREQARQVFSVPGLSDPGRLSAKVVCSLERVFRDCAPDVVFVHTPLSRKVAEAT